MNILLKMNMADRERQQRVADTLALAVAVSIPWSTSGAIICIVLWALSIIPILDVGDIRRMMARPEAYLPVALVALMALGMLWAPVPFAERFRGFDSYLKLLAIPLLFIQFHRSDRGHWVLVGFLVSCTVLLVSSFAVIVPWDGQNLPSTKGYGVIVKDYIAQSAEFMICAFGLGYLAISYSRKREYKYLLLCAGLAVLFFANIFFVISSRTALVVIPALVLLLSFRELGWKKSGFVIAGIVVLAAVIWSSSENVRDRLGGISQEIERYRVENAKSSTGERIDYWKRALVSISQAPVIGHGTGSIRELYRRTAEGVGISGKVPDNPHSQILGVAMQVGAVGAVLLIAVWLSHLRLFWREGLAAWIGLMVVTQNVISSLANSHLSDFLHGWLYVFAVGITGGMVMKSSMPVEKSAPASAPP